MAGIKQLTKFEFEGQEFNSLEEIKDKVTDRIGEEVIDQINRKIEIRHRDLLPLLEVLCQKDVREALTKYLNVNYTKYEFIDDEEEETRHNILDL